MWQIKHTVEIGVDRLTAPGEVNENGLLTAVTLISLKTGNAMADCLGTVGCTALDNLGVENSEFAFIETDSNLRGHLPNVPLV